MKKLFFFFFLVAIGYRIYLTNSQEKDYRDQWDEVMGYTLSFNLLLM